MIVPQRKANNVLFRDLCGNSQDSVFHTSLSFAELVCGLANYGMTWKEAVSVSDSDLYGANYRSLWMSDEEEEDMRKHYRETQA